MTIKSGEQQNLIIVPNKYTTHNPLQLKNGPSLKHSANWKNIKLTDIVI